MNKPESSSVATRIVASIAWRISRWVPLTLMLGTAWLLPKLKQAMQPSVAALIGKAKASATRAWRTARGKAKNTMNSSEAGDANADQVTGSQDEA